MRVHIIGYSLKILSMMDLTHSRRSSLFGL